MHAEHFFGVAWKTPQGAIPHRTRNVTRNATRIKRCPRRPAAPASMHDDRRFPWSLRPAHRPGMRTLVVAGAARRAPWVLRVLRDARKIGAKTAKSAPSAFGCLQFLDGMARHADQETAWERFSGSCWAAIEPLRVSALRQAPHAQGQHRYAY